MQSQRPPYCATAVFLSLSQLFGPKKSSSQHAAPLIIATEILYEGSPVVQIPLTRRQTNVGPMGAAEGHALDAGRICDGIELSPLTFTYCLPPGKLLQA